MKQWILALSLLLIVGCTKKKEETKETAQDETEATASAKAEVEPASAVPGALPTEEDFEEEAEKAVTVENMEAELDKLEKEIADQ
jgi:hypothetical protein